MGIHGHVLRKSSGRKKMKELVANCDHLRTLRDWHLSCNNKAPFHFGRVLHITNTTKGEITLQL